MQKKKQLRVGLYEEDLKWLVLLQTLLTHAGHAVSVCRERGERLRAWLATCSEPPGSSGLPPYDLLIVDVAEGGCWPTSRCLLTWSRSSACELLRSLC